MKTHKLFYRVLTVVILCVIMLLSPVSASAAVEPASIQSGQSGGTDVLAPPGTTLSLEVAQERALEAYGQLPLSFIPNQGQVDEQVGYYVQSGGQSLWFTADGVTMALPKATLRLEFLNANPLARLEGGDKLLGVVNYFVGNDPAKWRTNIPTYGRITYHDLWPGVDLTYKGRPGALKSTFTIATGADPAQIRLAYPDADSLTVDEQGNLVINAAGGEVRESAPQAWQELDGRRVPVAVAYQAIGQSYSFALPKGYDTTYPLVIDPELVYSTFLGGSSGDYGYAIAVDGAGNAYVTGYNCSSDFPITAGAFDADLGGYCDAFVAKLNAAGTGLAYATFLGGNGWDEGYAIAVDGAGSAYVTGSTDSSDFSTTVGAFDTSYNGGYRDAFVVKVNAAGTGLVYATFLGDSDRDHGYAIAVDGAGNAYVTGYTESSNFPTTAGAFDTSYNGGDSDAFVVKLNAAGTGLTYATFLGGSGYYESGKGIVVDGAGNVYVTGYTGSSDFPTTAGAFDMSYNGDCDDAFVVKLNAAGTGLAYATFLGGSGSACYWDGSEKGSDIVVDGAGNIYVTGSTYSSDFPTTPGAFDTTCGTDGACNPWYDDMWEIWQPTADAFVVKLNAAGTGLAYATFLGGSGWCGDEGYGIVVDGAGNVYVTGYTESSDFPTTAGAFDTSYNGGDSDVFVVKLNAAGTGLAYATFLGGSDSSCMCGGERGSGIVMDGAGNVYVTGSTYSSDFPTTPGAFDTTCGTDGACNPYPSFECGGLGPTADAFVAKLALGGGIIGKVTDGHGHSLSGVFVGLLKDAESSYAMTTTTNAEGNYTFANVPPATTYKVRVILRDGSNATRIHWGTNGLLVSAQTQPFSFPAGQTFVTKNIDFGDASLDSAPIPVDNLDDLAVMFYHSQQVANFTVNTLGQSAFQPVESVWGFSPSAGVFYEPGQQEVNIDASSSQWDDPNRPMNREWHENFHHLMNVTVGMPPFAGGEYNHRGFDNPSSDDSWAEGWAEFWPCVLWDVLGNPNPWLYRFGGIPPSFEDNWQVWDRQATASLEEFAVASLLWDLYDPKEPVDNDNVDLSPSALWQVIGQATLDNDLTDMRDVYNALWQATLTNEDGTPVTVADIDEAFTAHGFYADLDGDHQWDPGEEVGWAGLGYRRNTPKVQNAYIKVNVEDENGNPVQNSSLLVDVHFDNSYYDYSCTVNLSDAAGNMVYFSLPPTRTVATAELTVGDGVGRSDPYTVENSTYWDKVIGSTTGYAEEHTFVIHYKIYLPILLKNY